MRTLVVQIHTELLTGASPEAIIEMLTPIRDDATLVRDMTITSAQEPDCYMDIAFETNDLKRLWHAIQKSVDINGESAISNTMIVVCHGEKGWDDYLLLHHFDKSVTPDKL